MRTAFAFSFSLKAFIFAAQSFKFFPGSHESFSAP